MKYLIALLLLSPLLYGDEVPPGKNYDQRISRLYTCGKFFNIVGNQRKNPIEKKRYKTYSESSIELANKLIEKHQDELQGKHKKLIKKYNKSGRKAATWMIKNIGNSPSKDLFGQYVKECYSFHEKEDLLGTVDSLSGSLNK